jgi:hypothetical protein
VKGSERGLAELVNVGRSLRYRASGLSRYARAVNEQSRKRDAPRYAVAEHAPASLTGRDTQRYESMRERKGGDG